MMPTLHFARIDQLHFENNFSLPFLNASFGEIHYGGEGTLWAMGSFIICFLFPDARDVILETAGNGPLCRPGVAHINSS